MTPLPQFVGSIGRCDHCRRHWKEVEPHDTRICTGGACFPLCEFCWVARTPAERLPYYRRLFEFWENFCPPGSNYPWPAIEFAVLNEPLSWPQLEAQNELVREWHMQRHDRLAVNRWENEGGLVADDGEARR